ncbi:hypothetical protein IWX49DRAFT_13061 [Phyllosticta citricarpa]|uniref:Glycosyltransferase family 25 protein n=2 Tax=Phyllosticta TaxID=121621 RepID=A0ABR1MRY0_9PEZI
MSVQVSHTSLPRRPLRYIVAAAIAAFLFFLWSASSKSFRSSFALSAAARSAIVPVNSTLGFGAIYVVSKENSPRRKGLLQAANVTEIDLTLPVQPQWTLEDEDNFRLPENSTLGRGSLLAWLGHLHSLKKFIESGAETALILEDDVDWDIRLRSQQAPLVASAVRAILPDAPFPRYPYGNPKDWDLLYMGHCGDYWHGMDVGFEPGHVVPENLTKTPHIAFHDSSLPDFDNLHPWTTSLLQNLNVTEHTRLVHRSRFPLCTFGYAVTRMSAFRLLTELAGRESNRPGAHAYDVTILRACISDGLRCWSINPELFHHVPGDSMIAGIEGHQGIPPVDESGYEQVLERGETTNIDCGFWDGAFSFDEDDTRRLAWLQEEAARKGQCLKRVGQEQQSQKESVDQGHTEARNQEDGGLGSGVRVQHGQGQGTQGQDQGQPQGQAQSLKQNQNQNDGHAAWTQNQRLSPPGQPQTQQNQQSQQNQDKLENSHWDFDQKLRGGPSGGSGRGGSTTSNHAHKSDNSNDQDSGGRYQHHQRPRPPESMDLSDKDFREQLQKLEQEQENKNQQQQQQTGRQAQKAAMKEQQGHLEPGLEAESEEHVDRGGVRQGLV